MQMERVLSSLLLILSTDYFIESFPIKNGFSVKFKPLSTKEEVHPKTFGAIFAKISQEFTPEAILRREIFAKSLPPPSPELGSGCSNQVARVMYPMKQPDDNNGGGDGVSGGGRGGGSGTSGGGDSRSLPAERFHDWRRGNYLNLPIIKQPYKDYKVLVAEAPPELKMDHKNEKLVIYVVFSEDAAEEPSKLSLPEIYFVNKPTPTEKKDQLRNKNEIQSPILIVDQNRTVTGLKRKNIEKFLKFRNSLLKRYSYTKI